MNERGLIAGVAGVAAVAACVAGLAYVTAPDEVVDHRATHSFDDRNWVEQLLP